VAAVVSVAVAAGLEEAEVAVEAADIVVVADAEAVVTVAAGQGALHRCRVQLSDHR
jgi:hypothetical protein